MQKLEPKTKTSEKRWGEIQNLDPLTGKTSEKRWREIHNLDPLTGKITMSGPLNIPPLKQRGGGREIFKKSNVCTFEGPPSP
jgi:hypothetical protein